jgi:hypothetical protein
MRLRLGGPLLFALVVSYAMAACATAGVSAIYTSIDSAGAQRRVDFYTDTNTIYCVAKFSSARVDATLDFTISQKAVYQFSDGKPNARLVHPVFAVGEQTPGVGTETVVAQLIPPTGLDVNAACAGKAVMNLPTGGSTCSALGTAETAGQCPTSFKSLGYDSAGPGFTCCLPPPSSVITTEPAPAIPYPAGEYACDVSLDGVFQGETIFFVDFPPPASQPLPGGASSVNCPVPPPITGVPCYNWVPCDSKCPGYDPNETCTCEPSGIWSCG